MLHEDYAFYSYQEQYVMGDIVVMLSHEEDKGSFGIKGSWLSAV